MKLETILDKIKNKEYKECLLKFKFDKQGNYLCCFVEKKIKSEGKYEHNKSNR